MLHASALAPAIVHVSNDDTILFNSMTSQSQLEPLLRAHVNGTELVLIYTDRRLNTTLFLHVQGLNHGCFSVYIKGSQIYLFQ